MADSNPIEYQRDLGNALGADPGQLSPSLQAQIGQAIDDLITDWREELIEVWPRDTGWSFSQWESFRTGFVVILRNPVEYAGYVHPAGGEEGESWDTLREFFEVGAARLVATYAPMVAADRQQQMGVIPARLTGATRVLANRLDRIQVVAGRSLSVLVGRKPSRDLSIFRGVRRALDRVSSAERARVRDRSRIRVR